MVKGLVIKPFYHFNNFKVHFYIIFLFIYEYQQQLENCYFFVLKVTQKIFKKVLTLFLGYIGRGEAIEKATLPKCNTGVTLYDFYKKMFVFYYFVTIYMLYYLT